MNYAGKFDATFAAEGPATHSHAHVHVDSSQTHAPADAFIVPDAQLLFHGDYKRAGNDLILSKDHHEFVLHDYFRGEKRAAVASPDGAHLTADIIKALVGEVDVSQAGNVQAASQVIGHVTKLQGSATVVRNGVSIILNMGDNVEKGDVVQSGSNSTLGITFIDGTVFGLSSNARMVLNEMVYDPNGSSNSSLISLVAGTISFVAGETAKHGDMKIDTPVATMGIRGTACLVEIDFTVPGVNQSPQQVQPAPSASFQVLVEPDGTTGSYILFDKTTLQPIAIVNQAGQQININNGIISQTTQPLSPDVQKLINDVFQQKFTDNSNTKTNSPYNDSITPQQGPIIKLANGTTATPFFTVTGNGPGSSTPPPNQQSNGLSHLSGTLALQSLNLSGVAQTGFSTAELAGKTGDTFDFASVGGRFLFQDFNVGDRPSVTADFTSVTYTNANGAFTINAGQTSAPGLSGLQFSDIAATAIKLFLVPSAGNTNNGDVTWVYALRDKAFDFLAAGETLTFTYHVTVNGNFADAPEAKSVDVTITITGTNDRPQITTGTQQIDFAAGTKTPGGSLPTKDPTSGTLAFNDVDLTDTHKVSVQLTGQVMSKGGTIPPLPEQFFLNALTASIQTDSTGTGNGVVHWQFGGDSNNPSDPANLPVYLADFIPAGERLTLTYTVTLTDSSGDLATDVTTQTITVVITGTNAAAEVWIHTTTDGHDNLWTTGQNWETGTVPVATDDVIIITDQLHPDTPAYPVLIDDGTAAVAHSVTMNDFAAQSEDSAHVPPELDVESGASLTIGAGLSVSADAIVNNHGTVTVGGAAEFVDESTLENHGLFILQQGGDFSDFADITNAGTIEIAGGTLNVTVDIANCGAITVDSGATMTINGAAIHGGTVTVLGPDGVLNLLGVSSLKNGALDNTGQVNVDGTVTFDNETVNNLSGTITVAGTLILEQTTVTSGTIANNSDGEIDLTGLAVLTGGSLGNAGKLKVSGTGNALHNETVTANTTIEILAGAMLTLDLNSAIANSGGAVNVDDGGKLVLDGATIHDGTVNDGTAGGTAGLFGAIEIKGSSTFDQDATLNNGAVTIDAGQTLTLDNVTVNGATLTENAGGGIEFDHTVKLTGDTTIQGQSSSQLGSLTNLGTLDVSGAATLRDLAVTNNHVVQIDSGDTLNLDNATITGGTLEINGALDSTGDSFITDVAIDNVGNIHVTDGILTIDPAPFTNSGTILVTNGSTLVLDGETINNSVTDAENNVTNGTIQVDADATHIATLDLNGSSIVGGVVIISGVLDSTGDSGISSAVTNNGTIEVESGTLTLSGSVSGNGEAVIDHDATLAISGTDSQTIEFAGGNAELKILTNSLSATITGFTTSDKIDLSSIHYDLKTTTATFENGVLVVTDSFGDKIDLNLSGDFSNLYFFGSADQNSGTLVTIKSTDDVPVIAANEKTESGTVIEALLVTDSQQVDPAPPANGEIHFTDVDLTDRLTAAVDTQSVTWTDAHGHLLTLNPSQTAALEHAFALEQSGNNSGVIDWTYSITDSDLDFLAAGETATIITKIKLDDHHAGGTDTATVTVTVSGNNDLPNLSADSSLSHGVQERPDQTGDTADNDKACGSLSFTDVDLSDKHTSSFGVSAITWSGGSTLPSGLETVLTKAFSTSVATDSMGTGAGTVGFEFKATDNNFDFLADGETLTVVYDVTVTDNQGTSSTKPVTIVVTGTNDAPNLSADSSLSHDVQERLDQTGDTLDNDKACGTLSFTDVDLNDTHTTGFSVSGITWSGGATLPNGLEAALKAAFSTSVGADSKGSGAGTLDFAFKATDNNFDFLAAGETLTVVYDVTVIDSQGASSTKPVTIVVTGTNDGPNLSADSSLSHGVQERLDHTGDTADNDQACGTLAFSDVDLNDTHTTGFCVSEVSWSAGSALPTGLGTLLKEAFSTSVATESTGTGAGAVDFKFSAPDNIFDFLAAGETLTIVYNVSVTDSQGASSTEPVTIVVTGTNDAPMLNVDKTPALDAENAGAGAPVDGTAAGTLVSELVNVNPPQGGLDNVTDVDHGAVTGIALTCVDTSHGSWFYSIDGGVHWVQIGSLSTNSALLLAPDARLYFQPNAGYYGTDVGAITFHAWDQTFEHNGESGVDVSVNGGSTAFSTATDTADITINHPDIAPFVDLNGGLFGFDNLTFYLHGTHFPVPIAPFGVIADVDSPKLASMTVTLTDPEDNSAGDGGVNVKEFLTLTDKAAALAAKDGLTVSLSTPQTKDGPISLTITGSASVADYQAILEGVQYVDTKFGFQDRDSRVVTVVVNDGTLDSQARYVGVLTIGPAGAAGEPINLALADPSPDHLGLITATISGLPLGWSLSEGTHNDDGTWTVQTNDIAALSVTSAAQFSGALILDVSMSWVNADGSIGQTLVPDNVEVYAQGAPIFAWSGDDTLTASKASDLLVFSEPSGHDTVHAFDVSADRIDMIGFTGFSGFADVQSHLSEDASGNAVITITDGQSITLDGVHTASLTADNFVFDDEPAYTNSGTMAIENGASLPLTGIVNNSGTIALDSTGDQTGLELIQTGLTLKGGGHILLSDSESNLIVGTTPGVTLDNTDNTISGAGQIGDCELKLINEGTIDATGTNSLTIDTGSNTIVNSGILETSGSGGLHIDSAVENSGTLWAHGAKLTVEGQVSGSGTAIIDGAGTLDLESASTAKVTFAAGSGGTLELGDAFNFKGTVAGFGGADVINLDHVQFDGTPISYQENAAGDGGTLTISAGAQTVALSLSGEYTADNFHIVVDPKGTHLSYVSHELMV